MAKVHEVMHRVIDIRALMHGHGTGVDVYCKKILEALFDLDRKNQYILYYNSWRDVPDIFPNISRYKNVGIIRTRIPNKILNASLWLFKWPYLDSLIKKSVSIFFMPDLRPIALKKAPLITTFHDLSMIRYPEFFSMKTRMWHKIFSPKKIAQMSKKIMSVSQYTTQELHTLLAVPLKKIITSYEGPGVTKKNNNTQYRKKILKKYSIQKPYFVSLSSIEPRKNLTRLINAFKQFSVQNNDYQLVIIGRKNPIFSEIQLDHNDQIIFTGYISDDEKSALLDEALCLVYPSLYEGFGLPVLESYIHNKPVIASNVTSLPEVVGPGGILCDPYDEISISEALTAMIDKKTYEKYQKNIKKHLQKFSWKHAAQDLLQVMDAISLSSNNPE